MGGDNERLARSLYEKASSGDVEGMTGLLAPDFVDHNPDPDQPPGPAGVRAGFERLRSTFPDFTMAVEDVVAAGDKVVCRVRVSGTQQGDLPGLPATGRRFSAEAIDILRVEDGKLKERWGLFDGMTMMQQLNS